MNRRSVRKRIPGIEALKDPGAFRDADFTQAEWTAAIRAAVTGGKREKRPGRKTGLRFPVLGLRPAFGYALGLLFVGAAVLFGVRRFPWLVPVVENRPVAAAVIARKPDIVEPIDPEVVFPDSDLWARAEAAVAPATRPPLVSPSASVAPAGDVPSLTWISQETGLQIVWFINENLNLEE